MKLANSFFSQFMNQNSVHSSCESIPQNDEISGSTGKRLLIIGGGYAGAAIARSVNKHFNVTIIDPKPQFEGKIGLFHVATNPEVASDISCEHVRKNKGRIQMIQGNVSAINEAHSSVQLQNDETIPYDYLVLSSGSSYHSCLLDASNEKLIPLNNISDMIRANALLRSGRKVSIIGGGPAGVELCSEILDMMPHLNVNLIHSRTSLLHHFGAEASQFVHQHFRKYKQLSLILGSRVSQVGKDGSILTNDNRKIDSDVVFMAAAASFNTQFVPRNMLNQDRTLKVNPYLQSTINPRIYVAGDIAGTKEPKVANIAERHAATVAYNLIKDRYGVPHLKKQYSPQHFVNQCIVLGKKNAVVVKENGIDSGWKWAKLKRMLTMSESYPDKVDLEL